MKIVVPSFVLLGTFLVLSLLSLERFPPVGMDDTFISAPAHNFFQEGRFAHSMLRAVPVFRGTELTFGRLHLGGLALMGYLLGPSLISDRLWSWCMGLVALWFLWLLAKSSLGKYWGIATVVLCLAEPMFFSWSHIPRPEITMAALFLFAIWSGRKALDTASSMWFGLAGLLGGMALDVHLPGMMLAPALCLALSLSQRPFLRLRKNMVWFVAGVLAGLCYYAAVHIFPDPSLFFHQMRFLFVSNGQGHWTVNSLLSSASREYVRYSQWFVGDGLHNLRLIEGLLMLGGVFVQLRSRNVKSRYLAIVTVCLVCVMAVTVNRKAVYYLLPLYPLFVLHAAAALRFSVILVRARRLREEKRPGLEWYRYVGVCGLLALLFFYATQDLSKLYKSRDTDYARYISEITAVAPEGAVVAGASSLWYGLGRRNHLLSNHAVLWELDYEKYNGEDHDDVADVLRRNQVRYVVIEPAFRALLDANNAESTRRFSGFLHSHTRLVKSFSSAGYIGIGECPRDGLTEIYEVIWNSPQD